MPVNKLAKSLVIFRSNWRVLRGGIDPVMVLSRKWFTAKFMFLGISAFTVLMLFMGCSSGLPSQVEIVKQVPVEVVKEVPVEVVKEVEVIKEIEVERIVKKIRDSGSLIIYSGRSEKLVGPLIEQFADASGINVQVKYGKTAAIAATLLEEGQNSPADLFFAQDPGGLSVVSDLLTTISEDTLVLVPDWAKSSKNTWIGISGRARAVVYNPANIDESDLPDSLWGFIDHKWKGRIGWAPTNSSFQTMITGMRSLWGEDKTREWLNGIQANEPLVYPKNTPQVAAAAAGEIDVGLVNHYYLFRFLAEEGEDFSARNYHLRKTGPGSLIMVAGAGILDSSENKENADKFLKFMLSKVGQQYFTGQTFEYPLIEGVKTPHVLVPLREIRKPDLGPTDLEDMAGTQIMLQEIGILP